MYLVNIKLHLLKVPSLQQLFAYFLIQLYLTCTGYMHVNTIQMKQAVLINTHRFSDMIWNCIMCKALPWGVEYAVAEESRQCLVYTWCDGPMTKTRDLQVKASQREI